MTKLERMSKTNVERDLAVRGGSGRTPEAQRGAWLFHETSEHRTYDRRRPKRDGRSRRWFLRCALALGTAEFYGVGAGNARK